MGVFGGGSDVVRQHPHRVLQPSLALLKPTYASGAVIARSRHLSGGRRRAQNTSEALVVDHVLFELERDDLERRLKGGQGCALFIQSVIYERLDGVEHWHQFFEAIGCLSQDEGNYHETGVLV